MAMKSGLSIGGMKEYCIRWKDKIPDTEVIERAELPSVITTLRKVPTRWAGHVSRMQDLRISKQLMYGELSPGQTDCSRLTRALQRLPQSLPERLQH